jgi:hypothetical protein
MARMVQITFQLTDAAEAFLLEQVKITNASLSSVGVGAEWGLEEELRVVLWRALDAALTLGNLVVPSLHEEKAHLAAHPVIEHLTGEV